LPKGTRRKNESEKETAKREVLEETGFEVEVGWKIGHIGSTFQREGVTIKKTTHYFACKPIKKVKNELDGHDELKWVETDKAIELLSEFNKFEKEEDVVRKFVRLYSI